MRARYFTRKPRVKGPLRKVVGFPVVEKRIGDTTYKLQVTMLECGHDVPFKAGTPSRKICRKCGEADNVN